MADYDNISSDEDPGRGSIMGPSREQYMRVGAHDPLDRDQKWQELLQHIDLDFQERRNLAAHDRTRNLARWPENPAQEWSVNSFDGKQDWLVYPVDKTQIYKGFTESTGTRGTKLIISPKAIISQYSEEVTPQLSNE